MLTIAWDIDDVLNNLMQEWLEVCWIPKHPECTIKYEDLVENPPHKILGIELSEYLSSLDVFRASERYQYMKPVPEVLEWFEKSGHLFRHIALTATPNASASAQWLFKYYGQWIRTFHFIPSYRIDNPLIEYDKSKRDWLAWLDQVDIFVEDSESNLDRVKELDIAPYLMPRPWNKFRGKPISDFLLLDRY